MNSGSFKKDHIPWNKGKSFEAGGRSKESRFKKGNIPHNTRSDGEIRVQQKEGEPAYKYVRVSLGKWKLVHRLNYEKEYGEIPKGYILVCRTSDTLNCNTENWELITRRENLKRNQNRKKQAESMKKTWAKAKTLEAMGFGHWSGLNNR